MAVSFGIEICCYKSLITLKTYEVNLDFAALTLKDWQQFAEIDIKFHPRATILTGALGQLNPDPPLPEKPQLTPKSKDMRSMRKELGKR